LEETNLLALDGNTLFRDDHHFCLDFGIHPLSLKINGARAPESAVYFGRLVDMDVLKRKHRNGGAFGGSKADVLVNLYHRRRVMQKLTGRKFRNNQAG
jgi:hypothetical protein